MCSMSGYNQTVFLTVYITKLQIAGARSAVKRVYIITATRKFFSQSITFPTDAAVGYKTSSNSLYIYILISLLTPC